MVKSRYILDVSHAMVFFLRTLVLFYSVAVLISAQQFADDDVAADRYDELIKLDGDGLTPQETAELAKLMMPLGKRLRVEHEKPRGLETGDGAVGHLGAAEDSLCSNHTELFLQALATGEPWAAKMIDAAGRQPSALMFDFNLRWLGSWEECLAVEPVAYEDPANKTGPYTPFEPRYCQARITLKQMGTTIKPTVGMCLPSGCTPAEHKKLAGELAKQFLLPSGGATLTVGSVTCAETDQQLSDKAVAVIVVCCVFLAVMTLATVYDLVIKLHFTRTIVRKSAKKGLANPLYESTAIDEIEKGKIASGSMSSGSSSETSPLLGGPDFSQSVTQTRALSHQPHDVKKVVPPDACDVTEETVVMHTPGILGRMLLSFSVYTNGSKILDTSQAAGTLTAVNGIRFLSMSWVILGHTLAFHGQAPDNYNTWIAKQIKRWPFQAIANATVSVDTFFVLSGLLVAYLSLREMKKKGGPRKFNWFLYYFHRFWRLTPPYMLVMMVYVPLMGYWADGPIWRPQGIERNECEKTWWRNLLYINNLVEDKENGQCMAWSWYLANDMQFYVISPLMLVPLYYSKIAGSVVCSLFILANLIVTGVISKHYNYSATPKLDSPPEPRDHRSFDVIYIKPYTRIGPYVVGILLGYILYRTNCKVRMNKFLALVGWAVATTIGLLVVYGPYTSDGKYAMSEEESAFFNAAHRIGWGIAVAWVIFACATGYGGPVNTLLSWRGLIPLSRLTYCAYLVHPVVMMTYYNSVRALQHWYDLEFVYQFLSNLTLSMATAFVVSLAFESPMMGLEKVLLSKYKK